MARLPIPGGDADEWASILNEFLLVSHNQDGTQRVESIPPHSVELGDLDVKNNPDQNIANLVLTNDNNRLFWKDAWSLARSGSKLRINVVDFGAKGDGATDDTDAIQAAIDSAENGGIIEIPRGTFMIRGLKIKRHGITITGEARYGTRLVRLNGLEPLIDLSGTFTLDGHRKFCSVTNISLIGNYKPGVLLRAYFADNYVFRDVSFVHCDGVSVDFVEVWDTRFYNCSWENCGSMEEPAALFRNSLLQGEFGYGTDNTNQIHFLGCRWESFRNGAVALHGSANGSPHLLNGFFFVSCKMETRHAGGPAFQILPGSTLVFVNQLYIAIMAAEPDIVKPLDAIEDHGSHIFMTDVYVQWGSEVNIANSLVHVMRSGPHMYYKLSTYYPIQDPVEAAVVAEPGATDVLIACNVTNRGRAVKGDVASLLSSSPRIGANFPIDPSGTFKVSSNTTGKDLVKVDNTGTRPALNMMNGTDATGYAEGDIEKWRIVGSTGSARFASGKFQIEGTKGHVGINATPFTGIALLIKAAVEGDRGLAIVRPSGSAMGRLMEFQDETFNIQGLAIDANGRPQAVGTPPRVTAGAQVSYANPGVQVRDIAGNISAAVRPTPTEPGTIATVTFAKPYANPPLYISIVDHSATPGDLYVSSRSTTSFTVSTRTALRGGLLLNFDYSVIA
ncbi:MAG TPA: glycosyl hydrolase family 28-related protein [Candidatus Saccharimonadales bacterium]|nr:glycosyl hydrolase family 28-related protein [Candidatus Saccharimonadales bacterium]